MCYTNDPLKTVAMFFISISLWVTQNMAKIEAQKEIAEQMNKSIRHS